MRAATVNRRSVLRQALGVPAALLGFFGGRALASEGKACAPTSSDDQGPFYIPGAPRRAVLAGPREPGERVTMSGTVTGADCKTLSGALLDVWQADASGNYHNEKTQYRLRGILLTDAKGNYQFESVRPGNYGDRTGMRPAHFHFTLSHPEHQTLTSQIYFKGDPYLAPHDMCEECHSDDPGRIIELVPEKAGGKTRWNGRFDVVMKPARA